MIKFMLVLLVGGIRTYGSFIAHNNYKAFIKNFSIEVLKN
jgi:hypothetical protein